MRAALYARVSTERQADRGTIGSQLQLLRQRIAEVGDELVGEYVDDGHSGARLDRPGLDALRDAAEAGLVERVWCLSPDRLARAYAYQVLVLDELDRFGVAVAFTDSPGLAADDPQAILLTQVQGVIAEYEKAKIAERYRRGKLFRARAGEVVTWKASYGYRRIARSAATGAAHHEIYEPEAAVVRRIFAERAAGTTVREICRRLNADGIPSPTGKPTWGHSTLCRLLHNEAYIGRVYYNRTESVPDRRPTRRNRQVSRDRDEWIPIDCPRIISDELFQAAGRVATDNTKWSPRRAEPGQWLLKGLVKCGVCGVGTNCHKMRGRNGTWHRYYYCRNHDPLRAGGESRRCPERNIRADALDAFVFDHIRAAITHPDQLLAGEQAVALTTPIPDDELLTAELARLDRKIDAADAERRRLIDLYQGGFIELPEMQRRATEVSSRRKELQHKRTSLADERAALARDNQLRRRVHDFAARIHTVIDTLDDTQKQQLLRLLIEDVRVTGWHVEIRLRIALDPPPPRRPHPTGPTGKSSPHPRPVSVSTQDGLRSVGDNYRNVMPDATPAPGAPNRPVGWSLRQCRRTRWEHAWFVVRRPAHRPEDSPRLRHCRRAASFPFDPRTASDCTPRSSDLRTATRSCWRTASPAQSGYGPIRSRTCRRTTASSPSITAATARARCRHAGTATASTSWRAISTPCSTRRWHRVSARSSPDTRWAVSRSRRGPSGIPIGCRSVPTPSR
jgi:site-specific DNA recombinase